MTHNYTLTQKIILFIFQKVFSASNSSLKKYSRNLYLTSALLLIVNIISMWLFNNYEAKITPILNIDEENYDSLSDNVNLSINILEISLGLTGALLDFTPDKNGLAIKT